MNIEKLITDLTEIVGSRMHLHDEIAKQGKMPTMTDSKAWEKKYLGQVDILDLSSPTLAINTFKPQVDHFVMAILYALDEAYKDEVLHMKKMRRWWLEDQAKHTKLAEEVSDKWSKKLNELVAQYIGNHIEQLESVLEPK